MQIVCVNQGNYCGMGRHYVHVLMDMIRRNTEKDYKFICFTDDPEPYDCEKRPLQGKGWFSKLCLFSKEAGLDGQTFFFDLDTVVTSGIDDILSYTGDFCILRDFYRKDGLGSGLMSWKGDYSHIWEAYKREGYPDIVGGDQAWIEKFITNPDIFQDKFKGIYSYKAHCERWPPDDCKIVCFHGVPRPHQVNESWVNFIWKIGGSQHFGEDRNKDNMNTCREKVIKNMTENCALPLPWYLPKNPMSNNKTVCIVGGAPSLKKNLGKLREKIRLGAKVLSVNGTLKYLVSIGIKPDFHAQFDARPESAEFLEGCPDGVKYFIGSMSDPCVFNHVLNKDVEIWHGGFDIDEQMKILEPYQDKPIIIIGGGTTIGLRAMNLLFYKGYYKYDIFGIDSSFSEKDHHAYNQPQNDMDGWMNVYHDQKAYKCSPWMYRQALNFQAVYTDLTDKGCRIKVHGEGLIPDIWKVLNERSNVL